MEQQKSSRYEHPLEDVAIVAVHINSHSRSLQCCSDNLRELLAMKLAGNIYEHSANSQSVLLHDFLNIDWKTQERTLVRTIDFDIEGTNYHVINNEFSKRRYEIPNLRGDRLIVIGGGLEACHKEATKALIKKLDEDTTKADISELHFPADIIYESNSQEEEEEEEDSSGVHLVKDARKLLSYAELLDSKAGRIISLDGRIKYEDFSPEEKTFHMAFWSCFRDTADYIRNNRRLNFGRLKCA